jgi:hypothetical protein
MKNLTMQIKVLNQVYRDMKNNLDTLKKMFKKESGIHQKVILAEAMIGQIYLSIMDKIETDELNKQFFDIIKNIKKENNG